MQHNTGRRNMSPQDTPDEAEEWMTSYSDLISLLLCFFILFFAEYKKQADNALMLELGKTFTEVQDMKEENGEKQRARAQMLSQIESQVRDEMQLLDVPDLNMGIHRHRQEVLLRLYESDFFHVGSYNLKPAGRKVLNRVAELLSPYQDKVIIKVEGHSDSLPVNPFSSYQTNLNLSSLRASHAANVLISHDIDESRLRVVGFGAAKQLVPDRLPASEDGAAGKYIPENGLKNRRIEIRIQIMESDADKFIDLSF